MATAVRSVDVTENLSRTCHVSFLMHKGPSMGEAILTRV